MRVISKKKLRDYWYAHAQAEAPLAEWYFKIKYVQVENIIELRKVFNSVDPVNGYSVFNIGGNQFRLITAIHYHTQCCFVRKIWTHAEYSKRYNQDKLAKGDLCTRLTRPLIYVFYVLVLILSIEPFPASLFRAYEKPPQI